MNVSDEVRVFARRLSRRPLDRAAQKKRAIATPFFATEVPTLLSRRRPPPPRARRGTEPRVGAPPGLSARAG